MVLEKQSHQEPPEREGREEENVERGASDGHRGLNSGGSSSPTIPSVILPNSDIRPLTSTEQVILGPSAEPGTGNSNTEKTTKWALNTFNNWRNSRAENCGGKKGIPDLREASTVELNYWLAHFVRECKQKDGRDYKHQNLYAMMCGLARHIKKDRPLFNILDDPGMADFKLTLQEVMKRLQVKQANICPVPGAKLTRRQWDSLWDQGLLGESDPAALFNAVYFLFVTVTGLTSAAHLRSLTTKNVVVTSDPKSNSIVTFYYPNEYKSCKSDRAAIRCTETDRGNARSFGRLLELYLSKLPPTSPELWVRPSWRSCRGEFKDKAWYSGQPVGQNLLRTTVKSVCEMASLVGNYSNQSLDRDLLNWEHCNVEHVPTSSSKTPVFLYSGVKREYEEESLSMVTLNTHLPTSTPAAVPGPTTSSKRLRTSVPLTEQIFAREKNAAPFLSLGSAHQHSERSTQRVCSPPVVTTPSLDSPPLDVVTTSHDVISSPRGVTTSPRDVIRSQNVQITESQSSGKNSNPNNNDTGPNEGEETNNETNREPNVSNTMTGNDLRNVHVDIPEHVDKCLGLFKDCTIQNVTINIYLSKTGDNGH